MGGGDCSLALYTDLVEESGQELGKCGAHRCKAEAESPVWESLDSSSTPRCLSAKESWVRLLAESSLRGLQ